MDDQNLLQIYTANPKTEIADDVLHYLMEDYDGTPVDAAQTGAALRVDIIKNFLEFGGRIVWDAVDGYSVEIGRKLVNGAVLYWSSDIARTSLSLSNSTLYYVYLYDNSGTDALEESTTVPAWNSTYRYWQKTGDATRRCMGYFLTDGSGNILRFSTVLNGNTIDYIFADAGSANRRVVNGGTQTAQWDSVDLSSYAPIHSTHANLIIKLQSATATDDGTIGVSPIDLGAGNTAVTAPNHVRAEIPVNSAAVFFGASWNVIEEAQTLYYRILDNVGTGSTAYIELNGCRFDI